MAGQQDTLREQWRIAIIGAGGVGLSILLVEKFIIDPITPESVWVSIPVMATIITVGIAMARYWLIMGSYAAAAEGTREREKADGLREQLEQGGGAGEIYEAALTRFLNAVDRFFGDADPTVKTLWPGAFGFRGKAPFWTAPAYDRCLTIALLYPLLAMLIIWTVKGAVGPGEKAIGLGAHVEDWRRWVGFFSAIAAIVCSYFFSKVGTLRIKVNTLKIIIYCTIYATCTGLTIVFVGIDAGIFVIASAASFSGAAISSAAGALNVAIYISRFIAIFLIGTIMFFIVGVVAISGNLIIDFVFAILIAAVVAITAAGLAFASAAVGNVDRQGQFLASFSIIMLLLCYAIGYQLSETSGWRFGGALILFLGVLTLINAPFDWLTIGLTRALLRRGLELRRWWPLALALLDLVLAAVIIVLLAVAMLLAVQAFEYLGGAPILGVEKVLNDLADPEMRTHPEYWWLYATLFSTLIPSIINVAIGALSIMRGSGGFHRFVAAKMPAGQVMMLADALWAVPLLALEVLGSVVIGVALTLGWMWVVVAKLFPLFGGLIPMLRAVAGLG